MELWIEVLFCGYLLFQSFSNKKKISLQVSSDIFEDCGG